MSTLSLMNNFNHTTSTTSTTSTTTSLENCDGSCVVASIIIICMMLSCVLIILCKFIFDVCSYFIREYILKCCVKSSNDTVVDSSKNVNKYIIKKYSNSTKGTNTDCPICLDNLNSKMITLKCNHSYHKSCFVKYINSCSEIISCPLCRDIIAIDF